MRDRVIVAGSSREIATNGGRFGAALPLGRAAQPGEVAETVVFLLSEKASCATGAILDITGGLR